MLGFRQIEFERNEQSHFDREETLLTISNPARATIRLFKAGRDLQGAKLVEPFNGESAWLSKGNYFLQARQQDRTSFYPISILGYRSGPDADGTLTITIRSFPVSGPPPLTKDSGAWAYIPSGYFLLGERLNPIEPHFVWLPAFYISTFELTNAQFREFLRDFQGFKEDSNWTGEGKRWKSLNDSHATALLTPGDADYRRFGQDELPVVQVNWFEAQAFCHWLTQKVGQNRWQFSLPSEGEWEKAARGPDSFDYGLGMSVSDNEVPLYNWKKNPDTPVTLVGFRESTSRYLPNRYGLLHMSGNAAEWTLSVYHPYNREHPYVDDERNSESAQGLRVIRGGSWYTASIAVLSTSYRETFQPDVHTSYLGFRIVARILP